MCEVEGELGSQILRSVQEAATFPKMRRWDENGESWQQGSNRELIVVCTDYAEITRGIIMSVWITQLSWAGAEIGSRCSKLCVVHLAARVTEWPVGVATVGWVGRGLLLTLGTDKFGKQMLLRPSRNSSVVQGTFQQRYQWCKDHHAGCTLCNCVKLHLENFTKRVKATPK